MEGMFTGENRGNVREFGYQAVEAGADLVIGHEPHVFRAMEVYRKKLIAYSLGNPLTYGMFNLKGPNGTGAISQVRIDSETGDFLSRRIVPTSLRQGGPCNRSCTKRRQPRSVTYRRGLWAKGDPPKGTRGTLPRRIGAADSGPADCPPSLNVEIGILSLITPSP